MNAYIYGLKAITEFTFITEDEKESLKQYKEYKQKNKIYEEKLRKRQKLSEEKKQIELILLAKNKQKQQIEKELKLLDIEIQKMLKALDSMNINSACDKKLKKIGKKGMPPKSIICTDTGKTWESVTACAEYFDCSLANIIQTINSGYRVHRKYKLVYA